MNAENYYLDEGLVKITAASVGISSKRWTCINESGIEYTNFQEIMKRNRFDILPIISNEGEMTKFFKTESPNDYQNVSRREITEIDKIPLDTDIRDIIVKFDQERTYFFLTYEKKITGLITLANLNCKQVQVYIFSKICDLERTLGEFIKKNIYNEDIEEYMKTKVKGNDKFKVILYNYRELISLDLENNLTEHLFLVDFFDIIKKFSLNNQLKLTRNQLDNMNSINKLRNLIAHPTRSLLDGQNGIEKLHERLEMIEDLTQKLKRAIAFDEGSTATS